VITLTAKAAEQFAARIKAFNRGFDDSELNPCLIRYVRIGVRGGGCSGLQYSLNLESDKREGDTEESHLICKTVVDPISAMYLDGVTVDFDANDLSGGFIFSNPNSSAQCGCGKSFRA
jgi:iron-sulfur cluster assembly accessory protein